MTEKQYYLSTWHIWNNLFSLVDNRLANQAGYLKAGTIAFWLVYIIDALTSTLMGIILAIKRERNRNITSTKKV